MRTAGASLAFKRGRDAGVTGSVPVLVITGPVGSGKSTIAAEAGELLRKANLPHAVVDLARIGGSWPRPPDDPWNERVLHRNLAAMWSNFRDAGAQRLILSRVLETRGLLQPIAEAVPGAEITVIRLRVRLEVLQTRIRSREAGRDPEWFLGAAGNLVERLEQLRVENYVVENENRSATRVAEEALRLAGWVP
jgi:hypothetical protein